MRVLVSPRDGMPYWLELYALPPVLTLSALNMSPWLFKLHAGHLGACYVECEKRLARRTEFANAVFYSAMKPKGWSEK